jgi:hypothetical protein
MLKAMGGNCERRFMCRQKSADFGRRSQRAHFRPLRAGFLTGAARRGASVFKMRDVSRHKSIDVLQARVRRQ